MLIKMKSEAQIKFPICERCGHNRQYQKKVSRYCIRLYCQLCNKWVRGWPERIDKENQPSHCGKCIYFSERVFEGTTANGHGSWYGDCLCDESGRAETISRYYGCKFGIKKQRDE